MNQETVFEVSKTKQVAVTFVTAKKIEAIKKSKLLSGIRMTQSAIIAEAVNALADRLIAEKR